jgi:DNA-directed RNA polymerase subunit RPC12/RpoP
MFGKCENCGSNIFLKVMSLNFKRHDACPQCGALLKNKIFGKIWWSLPLLLTLLGVSFTTDSNTGPGKRVISAMIYYITAALILILIEWVFGYKVKQNKT